MLRFRLIVRLYKCTSTKRLDVSQHTGVALVVSLHGLLRHNLKMRYVTTTVRCMASTSSVG